MVHGHSLPFQYHTDPATAKQKALISDEDDLLIGTTGNDWIEGFDGKDRIQGKAGDDYIDAGFGSDVYVEGGSGADVFVFGLGYRAVKIYDWEDGVDKVLLKDGLTFDDIQSISTNQHGTTIAAFENLDGQQQRVIFTLVGEGVIDESDFIWA